MSGFQVGVGALVAPAQRLKQVSSDLWTASAGAATAAGSGGGAAGDPAVISAAAVFEAGVRAVLGALGDDADLLGTKVQQAGVTYEAVDATAMPTGAAPGGSGPGPGGPGGSGGSAPGAAPSGFAPTGSPPAGSVPTGSAPAGSVPAGSVPAGSVPAGSVPTGSVPTGSAPAGAAPVGSARAVAEVRVSSGDSLWSIAAQRLGPGATPAAVTAEVHRWHDANRSTIGPNPDRLSAGATLRAPGGTP